MERAHAAVEEIATREPGDDARAVEDAAERATAEEARRTDLIHWSELAVEASTDREASDDDTLARDR